MEAWFSEALSFVFGVLAGVGLKVVIDKRRIDRSVATTVQQGNRVGGHQAGRDVTVEARENNE